MKILINYSDNRFWKRKQFKNSITGIRNGGFDKVISYSRKDIDKNFYENNKKILEKKKGGGYWLWKPYFIKKTLDKISNGDYIFYADSGSYFNNNIEPLINKMNNTDILTFIQGNTEKKYTKRDLFIKLNCDNYEITDTPQIMATFLLLRKSNSSINFINKWLKLCTDYQLITDSNNKLSFPNYKEFIEHRHDQSILSVLSKKMKIKSINLPRICSKNKSIQEIHKLDSKIIVVSTRRDPRF